MRSLTKLFDAVRHLSRHAALRPCYICDVEPGTLTTIRQQPVCTACWTLTPDYAEHLRRVEHMVRTLHSYVQVQGFWVRLPTSEVHRSVGSERIQLHGMGDGALRRRSIKLLSAGWLPHSVFRPGAGPV